LLCLLISKKAGSFLIEDLYAVDLTRTEQFWIFWAFFLAYAIKIPLIPFHTWQASVPKKHLLLDDAFVRDYVKDGL
jgi:NADH-quinone oxidoreductase subunit M